MTNTLQIDWIKSEAFNLENCCNDNPLNILGPHKNEDSWVIRVWMPEADQVRILFLNTIETSSASGIQTLITQLFSTKCGPSSFRGLSLQQFSRLEASDLIQSNCSC